MVFDYKILPIRRETIGSPYRIRGFSRRRQVVTRKLKRDRRKLTYDRRKSVRDGVIVSLSFTRDRRKIRDRRKVSGERRKTAFQDIIFL
ncbi:MAG: hypothetical protein GY710_18855 [Desulfobacteraceae bacterium]|nr:hypothetical protein [Desulfobacteraceae bacterium]